MSALSVFAPELRIRVTLPKKIPSKLYTPSDQDVKNLLAAIDDDELSLAVLLAAFGPLRRGELCALERGDIDNNLITCTKSMVKDFDGAWHVQKRPKTDSSFRTVDFPEFVVKHIPDKDGRIFDCNPDQITNRFHRTIQKTNLHPLRFHDLRHYAASIMHAIGVPDQYIIARGGWATDGIMKSVYRNTIDEQAEKMNRKTHEHFSKL